MMTRSKTINAANAVANAVNADAVNAVNAENADAENVDAVNAENVENVDAENAANADAPIVYPSMFDRWRLPL